jgi:hypothetical protein
LSGVALAGVIFSTGTLPKLRLSVVTLSASGMRAISLSKDSRVSLSVMFPRFAARSLHHAQNAATSGSFSAIVVGLPDKVA